MITWYDKPEKHKQAWTCMTQPLNRGMSPALDALLDAVGYDNPEDVCVWDCNEAWAINPHGKGLGAYWIRKDVCNYCPVCGKRVKVRENKEGT